MELDIVGAWRYPPPRAEWLARGNEPVLEPDLPIVDAHHHLWEQEGNLYLLDALLTISPPATTSSLRLRPSAFRYRSDGPGRLRCVGETEKVEALTKRLARYELSRRHRAPSGTVDLLADPRYRADLATLARHGPSYDAVLYQQQIPELVANTTNLLSS